MMGWKEQYFIAGTVAGLVSFACATAPVAASSVPMAQAMPIDLAFSAADFGYEARPSISSDGRWLAYTIHKSPAKSPPDSRYLPNGTPTSVVGSTVALLDTRAQKEISVGPRGADCWRPSLAPDASRVAFYCNANDAVHLWVHDLAKGESHQLGAAVVKPMLWSGDEPTWSNDGNEIFVPQSSGVAALGKNELVARAAANEPQVIVHRAGNELPKEQQAAASNLEISAHFMRENNAAIVAIDATTGTVRTLAAANSVPPPNVLQLSPSGKWVSYLSVFHKPDSLGSKSLHDIVVVPAEGGTPRVIATDVSVGEGNYYLDSYSWHGSRDQLFWMKDSRLWTVDLSHPSAQPRQLATQLTDVTRQPLVVTRDGSAVIVGVHPLDMRDYRDPYPQALAVVDLKGAEPKIVPLPQGFVFGGVVKQSATVAWQPQASAVNVYGRESATARSQIVRLDPGTGESRVLWSGLAKLRPWGAPADHGSLIAAYEDVNTPVDYYRFDTAFSSKRRLTQIEPRLAGIRFGTAETFETEVPQHDGSMIKVTTAVLLPPGKKRGDRLPTLVFLYPGGKVSRSAAEFGGGAPSTVPVSIFTTRGYAVLLAELPIGPEGKPGNPISEMVDVLVPQVNHAAALGYTDLQRVAVSGQSYGGYGTASVISGTHLFRAAVAISGTYDLPGNYARMDRNGGSDVMRWAETGQGRMGNPPWSDLQRYLNNSPYYRADRIHTPLLMLHGQIDYTCPVEDARKMFAALKRLERTVQLAEYADEGHVVTDWSLVNATDAAQRMVEFLDRYL